MRVRKADAGSPPRRPPSGIPRRLASSTRASSSARATAAFAAWWLPSSPTCNPGSGRPGVTASTTRPSQPAWRSVAAYGCPGPARRSGAPTAAHRSRMGARPRPRAPVTARLPALMMAAFSPPIAASVVPRCRSWSCWTLVIAATPVSSTFVASRRPPSPTSTSTRSTFAAASSVKAAAVRASNSVGRAEPGGDPLDGGSDHRQRGGEALAADRPAVDRDPLPVADQVWLRHAADPQAGLVEHRAGERHHAALAVRATHQRPAQASLGIPQLGEQRLDAGQAQADPESAAAAQRRDGLVVVEGVRRHRGREPIGPDRIRLPRPRRRRSRGTGRSCTGR